MWWCAMETKKKKKKLDGIIDTCFLDHAMLICCTVFCYFAFRQIKTLHEFKIVLSEHMWLLLMYHLLVVLFIEGYYITYTFLILWMYLKVFVI